MPGQENNNGQGNATDQQDDSLVGTAEFVVTDEQQSADLAASAADEKKTTHANEKTLNLVVDDVPYIVKVSPFSFNGETRFYVSVNDGADHVFTWDSEVSQLRAIDDASSELPDVLEEAISAKLQSLQK